MKTLFLGILSLLFCFSLHAQNATDDFSGKWKVPEGKVVEIKKKGAQFEGTTLDRKKIILKEVTFKKGKWQGTLIRPEDDVEFPCELTLKGGQLKVKAYKGILSKTLTWTSEN